MQCKGSLAVKQLIIKLILGILIMPVRLKWIWILFRIIVMKLMLTVVFSSTAVRSKWTKFFLLFPFFSFLCFLFWNFVYDKAYWFLTYVKCNSWTAGNNHRWGKHNHQHMRCLCVWECCSCWCAFGYHPVYYFWDIYIQFMLKLVMPIIIHSILLWS